MNNGSVSNSTNNNPLLDVSTSQPTKPAKVSHASSQQRQETTAADRKESRQSERSKRFDQEYDRAKRRQEKSQQADDSDKAQPTARRGNRESSEVETNQPVGDQAHVRLSQSITDEKSVTLLLGSEEELSDADEDPTDLMADLAVGQHEAGQIELGTEHAQIAQVKQANGSELEATVNLSGRAVRAETTLEGAEKEGMESEGQTKLIGQLNEGKRNSSGDFKGSKGQLTEQTLRMSGTELNSPEEEAQKNSDFKKAQSIAMGEQRGDLTAQKQKGVDMQPILQSTRINTTFGKPEWGGAVNQRVLWLANQEVSAARIIMSPPELGPIEVQLKIKSDQSQVFFFTHNQGVKEVLESELPKLRELFEENGLTLADAGVHDQSEQRGDEGEESSGQNSGREGIADSEEGLLRSDEVTLGEGLVSETLVDYYI